MKKLFLMSAVLLLGMAVMAQDPVITFEKTEHDFGQINEGDGRVSVIFEFKNEGMAPLVLSNVRASCGCTTPTWTKTPVEPGEVGSITVTYNPNGRPGKFQKTVTITSNATTPTTKVYIKGEVIPKTVKPVDKYPVKMGELSMKERRADFGTVKKGQTLARTLEYANQTDHQITVNIHYVQDGLIIPELSFLTLEPNQAGTLTLSLVSDNTNEYGPIERTYHMVVNGKVVLEDEYAVRLVANIEEDFSTLTDKQRQKAPILEIAEEVDLGKVQAGGKLQGKLALKNANSDPLYIRRIVNNNPAMLTVAAQKATVKGGKSTNLNITVTAKNEKGDNLKPGVYRRQVELITNDPEKSKKRITIVWTVE